MATTHNLTQHTFFHAAREHRRRQERDVMHEALGTHGDSLLLLRDDAQCL